MDEERHRRLIEDGVVIRGAMMGNDGDNLDRPAPVTREELDALVKRIEALEAKSSNFVGYRLDSCEHDEIILCEKRKYRPPGAQ